MPSTSSLGSTASAPSKPPSPPSPPGIPVIADAKRGDLGNTSRAYAKALFETWGFDAATVNPYLGGDSLEPFLDYGEKGVFILCRTSNPGSSDLQSLLTTTTALDGGAPMPLYQRVALMALEWNGRGNAGLVVGATQPDELRWVREHCPSMPLLIPGVGAQGGDLAAAVRGGVDANGELAIINSSREILYAFRDDSAGGFAEAARRAAVRARRPHARGPAGAPVAARQRREDGPCRKKFSRCAWETSSF